jgi:ribosomal protein S18 acetylase RimI-like enzyme
VTQVAKENVASYTTRGNVSSSADVVYTFKNAEGKEVFIGIDTKAENRVALYGTISGGVASIQQAVNYGTDTAWSATAVGGFIITKFSTGAFQGFLNGQGTTADVTQVAKENVASYTTRGNVSSSADVVYTFKNAEGKEVFIGIDTKAENRVALTGIIADKTTTILMAMNFAKDTAWQALDRNGGLYITTRISDGGFVCFYKGEGTRIDVVERIVNGQRVYEVQGEIKVRLEELDAAAVRAWAHAMGYTLSNDQFRGGIRTIIVDASGAVRVAAGISDEAFVNDVTSFMTENQSWNTATVDLLTTKLVNKYTKPLLLSEAYLMRTIQFFDVTNVMGREGNYIANLSSYTKYQGTDVGDHRQTEPDYVEFDKPIVLSENNVIKGIYVEPRQGASDATLSATPTAAVTRTEDFYGATWIETYKTEAGGSVAMSFSINRGSFAEQNASFASIEQFTSTYSPWINEVGSHAQASISYNATGRYDELSGISGTAQASFVDENGRRMFQNAFLPLESSVNETIAASNPAYAQAWAEFQKLTAGVSLIYGGKPETMLQNAGQFYADVINYWTTGAMGEQLEAFKNGGSIRDIDSFIELNGALPDEPSRYETSYYASLSSFLQEPTYSRSVDDHQIDGLKSVLKVAYSSISIENQEMISVRGQDVSASVIYSFGPEAKDRATTVTFFNLETGKTERFGFDRSVSYNKVFAELNESWAKQGLTDEKVLDPVELASIRFNLDETSVAGLMNTYGVMKSGAILNAEGFVEKGYRCNEWLEISDVNFTGLFEAASFEVTVHAFDAREVNGNIKMSESQTIVLTYRIRDFNTTDMNSPEFVLGSDTASLATFAQRASVLEKVANLEGFFKLEITEGPGHGLEILRVSNPDGSFKGYQLGGTLSAQFKQFAGDRQNMIFDTAGLRTYTDPKTGQLVYGIFGRNTTEEAASIQLFTNKTTVQQINPLTGTVVGGEHLSWWGAMSGGQKVGWGVVGVIGVVAGALTVEFWGPIAAFFGVSGATLSTAGAIGVGTAVCSATYLGAWATDRFIITGAPTVMSDAFLAGAAISAATGATALLVVGGVQLLGALGTASTWTTATWTTLAGFKAAFGVTLATLGSSGLWYGNTHLLLMFNQDAIQGTWLATTLMPMSEKLQYLSFLGMVVPLLGMAQNGIRLLQSGIQTGGGLLQTGWSAAQKGWAAVQTTFSTWNSTKAFALSSLGYLPKIAYNAVATPTGRIVLGGMVYAGGAYASYRGAEWGQIVKAIGVGLAAWGASGIVATRINASIVLKEMFLSTPVARVATTAGLTGLGIVLSADTKTEAGQALRRFGFALMIAGFGTVAVRSIGKLAIAQFTTEVASDSYKLVKATAWVKLLSNMSVLASGSALGLGLIGDQLLGIEGLRDFTAIATQIFGTALALRLAPFFFGNPLMASGLVGTERVLYAGGSSLSWIGAGMMVAAKLTGGDQWMDSTLYKLGAALFVAGFATRVVAGLRIMKGVALTATGRIDFTTRALERSLLESDLALQWGGKLYGIAGAYMKDFSAAFWQQAAGSYFMFRMFPLTQAVLGIDHLVDYILLIFGGDRVMTQGRSWGEQIAKAWSENWSFSGTKGGLFDAERLIHDIFLGQILHFAGVSYSARSTGILGAMSEAQGLVKSIYKVVSPSRFAQNLAKSQLAGEAKNLSFSQWFAHFVDNMAMFNAFMAPAQAAALALNGPQEEQEVSYGQQILGIPMMLFSFITMPAGLFSAAVKNDTSSWAEFSSALSQYILFLVPQAHQPFVLQGAMSDMKEEFGVRLQDRAQIRAVIDGKIQELLGRKDALGNQFDASVRALVTTYFDRAISKEATIDDIAAAFYMLQEVGKSYKGEWLAALQTKIETVGAERNAFTDKGVLADIARTYFSEIKQGQAWGSLARELGQMGILVQVAEEVRGQQSRAAELAKEAEALLIVPAMQVYVFEGGSREMGEEVILTRDIFLKALSKIQDAMRMTDPADTTTYDRYKQIETSILDQGRKSGQLTEKDLAFPARDPNAAVYVTAMVVDLEMSGILREVGESMPQTPQDAATVLSLIAQGRLSVEYVNHLANIMAEKIYADIVGSALMAPANTVEEQNARRKLFETLIPHEGFEKQDGRRLGDVMKEFGISDAGLSKTFLDMKLNGDMRRVALGLLISAVDFVALNTTVEAMLEGQSFAEFKAGTIVVKTALGDMTLDVTGFTVLAGMSGGKVKAYAEYLFDGIRRDLVKNAPTSELRNFFSNAKSVKDLAKNEQALAAFARELESMLLGEKSLFAQNGLFAGREFVLSVVNLYSGRDGVAHMMYETYQSRIKSGQYEFRLTEDAQNLQTLQTRQEALSVKQAELRAAAKGKALAFAQGLEYKANEMELADLGVKIAVLEANVKANGQHRLWEVRDVTGVLLSAPRMVDGLFGEMIVEKGVLSSFDRYVIFRRNMAADRIAENYLGRIGEFAKALQDLKATKGAVTADDIIQMIQSRLTTPGAEVWKAGETTIQDPQKAVAFTAQVMEALKTLATDPVTFGQFLEAFLTSSQVSQKEMISTGLIWARIDKGESLGFSGSRISEFIRDMGQFAGLVKGYQEAFRGLNLKAVREYGALSESQVAAMIPEISGRAAKDARSVTLIERFIQAQATGGKSAADIARSLAQFADVAKTVETHLAKGEVLKAFDVFENFLQSTVGQFITPDVGGRVADLLASAETAKKNGQIQAYETDITAAIRQLELAGVKVADNAMTGTVKSELVRLIEAGNIEGAQKMLERVQTDSNKKVGVFSSLVELFLTVSRESVARTGEADKLNVLYFKLFSRGTGDAYTIFDPRIMITTRDMAQNWDVLAAAFAYFYGPKGTTVDGVVDMSSRKYWFNAPLRDAYVKMRGTYNENGEVVTEGRIGNAPMGVGKTMLGLTLAFLQKMDLILLPSANHFQQMIREGDIAFFEAISGRRVVNAIELGNVIKSGGEKGMQALAQLITAFKDKNCLVISDRATIAEVWNHLRTTPDKEMGAQLTSFVNAFRETYRNFDEVHQCADPMYFIVGGQTRFADTLSNYKILDAFAQVAGDVLCFRPENYKEGQSVLVLRVEDIGSERAETLFANAQKENRAAVVIRNRQIDKWTGEKQIRDAFVNFFKANGMAEIAALMEKGIGKGIDPISGSELSSIIAACAVDYLDPVKVNLHLFGRGGVGRSGLQYRPVDGNGELQVNQIIEDTAKLIGVAHTVNRAIEAIRNGKVKDVSPALLEMLQANALPYKETADRKRLPQTATIELTSTVTAVSMFDLFITAEGVRNPLGMTGTALGVQVPLEVLMARQVHAVEVAGETMSFLTEMFSKAHQGDGARHYFGVGESIEFTPQKIADMIERYVTNRDGLNAAEEGKGFTPTLAGFGDNFTLREVGRILRERGIMVLEINEMTGRDGTRTPTDIVQEFNSMVKGSKDKAPVKNVVVLANQRGLTGLNYQAEANFLMFDCTLPEAQLMQSAWRIGRTKGGIGERWASHAVVFLEKGYAENILSMFSGDLNNSRYEAYRSYFESRLADPQTRRGLEWWQHGEGAAFETSGKEVRGDGWTHTTVVDLLTKANRSVDSLTNSEKIILLTAINTAEASNQTARSLLEQLWTFRLMIDPVRNAYSRALESGDANAVATIEEFGMELHRHFKSSVGLEASEKFSLGSDYVRSVSFERVDRTLKEFRGFLENKGAGLSDVVKNEILRGVRLAEEVKTQLQYNTIRPESPEFKGVFQGNLPTDTVLCARSLIAIAQRFAVDILPSSAGGTKPFERSAQQQYRSSSTVVIPEADAKALVGEANFQKYVRSGDPVQIHIVRDERTGAITGALIQGNVSLDIKNFNNNPLLQPLLALPYLTMSVSQNGVITVAPDVDALTSHPGELAHSERVAFIAMTGLPTELMTNGQTVAQILKVQDWMDQANIGVADRNILTKLALDTSDWQAFVKDFDAATNYEKRYEILLQAAPGLTVPTLQALASQRTEQISVMHNLGSYAKAEAQVLSWIKTVVPKADVRGINLFHVWVALNNFSNTKGTDLQKFLAAAITASREIPIAVRQEIAKAALGLTDAQVKVMSAQLTNMWSDVLSIAAANALMNGQFDQMGNKLDDVHKLVEREYKLNMTDENTGAARVNPIALSEIIKLRVSMNKSAEVITKAVELYQDLMSDKTLQFRTLDEAVLMVELGYQTSIQARAYLGEIAKLQWTVDSAHSFLEVAQAVGNNFSAAQTKLVRQVTAANAKGQRLEIMDMYGRNRHEIRGVTAKDVKVVYDKGAWTVDITADDGTHHALEIRFDTLRHDIFDATGERMLGLLRKDREILFSSLPSIDNRQAALHLGNSEDVLRVNVETAADGGRIIRFGTEDSSETAKALIESGSMEVVYGKDGARQLMMVRDLLDNRNVNSGMRVIVEGTEQGSGPLQYLGRDVLLPPQATVIAFNADTGVATIRIDSLSFDIDLSTFVDQEGQTKHKNQVIDLENILPDLQGFTVFPEELAKMSLEERFKTLLERNTAFKQFVAARIYGLLPVDQREAFVKWWKEEASFASEPSLVTAIRNWKNKSGIASAALDTALGELSVLFRDVELARKHLGQGANPLMRILYRAQQVQMDSPEALDIVQAMLDIYFGSDAEAKKRFIEALPASVLIKNIMKAMQEKAQKKPALLKVYKEFKKEYEALSSGRSKYDATLPEILALFNRYGTLVAESGAQSSVASLAEYQAMSAFFTGAQIGNLFARAKDVRAERLGRLLSDTVEEAELQSQIDYILSRAPSSDIFQFERLRHWSKAENNVLVREIEQAQSALGEKEKEAHYRNTAAVLADQFLKMSNGERGITDDAAHRTRDLIIQEFKDLLMAGDKQLHPDLNPATSDFVEFIFQPSSQVSGTKLPAAKGQDQQWREQNGYRNHAVPVLVFHGEAAKKLGKYWNFVGNDWERRSGAETFVPAEFDKHTGDPSDIFSKTGVLLIDQRWLAQSFFHEEQHLIFPRSYLLTDTDARLEEVMTFFAQMQARLEDKEKGRVYDIQMIREKYEQYARGAQRFNWEVMEGAFKAVVYLSQQVQDPQLVQDILRNSERVEDLLWWHEMEPMDLKNEIDIVRTALVAKRPAAATAQPDQVRAYAYSVLGRTVPGLKVEEAVGTPEASTPARELRRLFEEIVLSQKTDAGFALLAQFLKGDQQKRMGWDIVAKIAYEVLSSSVEAIPGLQSYLYRNNIKMLPKVEKMLADNVAPSAEQVQTIVREVSVALAQGRAEERSSWEAVEPILQPYLSAELIAKLGKVKSEGILEAYEDLLSIAFVELLNKTMSASEAEKTWREIRISIRKSETARVVDILRGLNSKDPAARKLAIDWILTNLDDSVDHLKDRGLTAALLEHATFDEAQGLIQLDPADIKNAPTNFVIKDKDSGASEPFGRHQQYLRFTFVTKDSSPVTIKHELGHDEHNLYEWDYDGRIFRAFYGKITPQQFMEQRVKGEIHSYGRELWAEGGIMSLTPEIRAPELLKHWAEVEQRLEGYLARYAQDLQDPVLGFGVSADEAEKLVEIVKAKIQKVVRAMPAAQMGMTDLGYRDFVLNQNLDGLIVALYEGTTHEIPEVGFKGTFRSFKVTTDPERFQQAVAISDATGKQNGLTDFSAESFVSILSQDRVAGFSQLYERDEKVLGYLLAAPSKFGGAYIYNIGVDRSAQSGGVGTALIYDLAKRLVEKMDAEAPIVLSVETKNEKAVKWYESLGFERVGPVRKTSDGREYYDFMSHASSVMTKAQGRLSAPRAELREAAETRAGETPHLGLKMQTSVAPVVPGAAFVAPENFSAHIEDWKNSVEQELLAAGKDQNFVESLKLTLLKIDMLGLSDSEKSQLAQVFAKFLVMMPNIEVATAFLGQNNIVLKLHAGDQQFQAAAGQSDRLAYVSYDTRGARAPIIGLNVAQLLNPEIPIEVRAVRYLGIPLSQEEAHYNLTKVLRMVPELVKPENEAMYDTVQEVLAYVVTMNDMKQATEDYGAQIPELDFTKQMANITFLWEKATGLPLTSELRRDILSLHKTSDPKFVQDLLRKLMGAITEAKRSPAGLAAQSALVGKPIDQVMKYDDQFVVAVQVADADVVELCKTVIEQLGYQKNISMMDAKGNVDREGRSQKITSIASQYSGRTVVAMSDMVRPVTQLVSAQKAFALMFDDDMIRALKKTRDTQKLREVFEALRILAMSLDPKTWTYLRNTGAGMGGPGSSSGIPTVSAYFDTIRQSFFAEALAASAA